MSSKSISEIKQFMSQPDMTDQEKIKVLLRSYAADVKAYNSICEELRNLMKNRLVEELEQRLNDLNPPLQEQYGVFQEPAVKDFLETAELYGLEIPVADNIFDELGEAILGNMELQPLIIRYRQVARGNNVQAKVQIIRQILKLRPEDSLEWEQNLVEFEREWKSQLQAQAKQAIIAKDYKTLAAIQEIIHSEPWKAPFNEKVIAKVDSVMKTEERRRKREECEQLVHFADELTGKGGNHGALEVCLERIHNLLASDDGIQIAPEASTRLHLVETELQKRKSIEALEQGMRANATLKEVDRLFHELQRLMPKIPLGIKLRVDAYRQEKIAFAKRRKMQLAGCYGVATFVVLLVVVLLYHRSVKKATTIEAYCGKMQMVVENRAVTSDVGYGLLKELEEKVPGSGKNPVVAALAEKLDLKRKEEEDASLRRRQFDELKQKIVSQMELYAGNVQPILEEMEEIERIALPEHQKELAGLRERQEKLHASYLQELEDDYGKLCAEMERLLPNMLSTMEEELFYQARRLLNQMEEKLKVMKAVPEVFRAEKHRQDARMTQKRCSDELERLNADYAVSLTMKKMDGMLKSILASCNIQKLGEAEKERTLLLQMNDDFEKEVWTRSDPLKKEYRRFQTRLKELGESLEKNRKMVKNAEDALEKIFSKGNWDDMKAGIAAFKAQYPTFYNTKGIDALNDEISVCLSDELRNYDARDEQGQRFRKKFAQLAEDLRNLLVVQKNDPAFYGVFMVGFVNMATSAPGELYMKSAYYDGIEITVNRNSERLPNVICGQSRYQNVIIANNNLNYVDNNSFLQPFLTFSSLTTGRNELRNRIYTVKGPCGDWVAFLDKKIDDLHSLREWRFLDQSFWKLVGEKTDGVRCVLLWKKIAEAILDDDPCFKSGGEFELTEILKIRKELEKLVSVFPKGAYWASAAFQYPNECALFYRKLDELLLIEDISDWSFARPIVRLTTKYGSLFPAAIAIRKNDGEWRCQKLAQTTDFFKWVAAPGERKTAVPFYVADHKEKTSRRAGSFFVKLEDKASTPIVTLSSLAGIEETPNDYFILYVKK